MGENGGNGEISSYFVEKWRRFACQSSNASAFVAVGAGVIPGSVCPHGLLLVQFSLCLLLFVLLFVPDTMSHHIFSPGQ